MNKRKHRGFRPASGGDRPKFTPGFKPSAGGFEAPPPAPGKDWLYGTHAVLAALANPRRRRRRLLATAEAAKSLPPQPDPAPEIVTRAEIDAVLPPDAVHQGLALRVDPLPEPSLAEVIDGLGDAPRAVVVVLDQPSDPRNVGAVLRTAAAFGAAAVVVPDRHAPEASGLMAKAASGGLETVPLLRPANLVQAIESLKESGFWAVGFDGTAEKSLAETDLGGKVVLVLGAEGSGLRRLTREHCDFLARIPIGAGPVDSLNLSNAAAIALYDWARRLG